MQGYGSKSISGCFLRTWNYTTRDWDNAGQDSSLQDTGPPDETMQPAEFATSAAMASPSSSTASVTPTVPINWAEVSYLTGVAQNGTLTNSSYWGSNGETARKWMNGTSGRGGPAGAGGGTVTYYFDATSNWSDAEQAAFVGGLNLWSAEANIHFAAATSASLADVVFYRGSDGGAYTSTPAYDGSGSTIGKIFGDSLGPQGQSEISIDTSQASWSQLTSFSKIGGYGIATIVHEEGHLLGLGHAGPYNGTVNPRTQQQGPLDSRLWSGMSYIRPEDTSAKYYSSYPVSGTNWGTTSDFYYRAPYTPMPLDILAAQQLYGAPTNSTLSGGQVFGFNCNISASTGIRSWFDFTIDTSPVITLFDTGVNNTLDLSGYTQNSTVDLRDGHFSSVAGLVNNIGIAYNTKIDNAVGGTGNDAFQVNADNDAINGEAGTDTVSFLGNRAEYSVSKNASGVVTVLDSNTSRGGTDQLTNIETLKFADQSVATASLPQTDPSTQIFAFNFVDAKVTYSSSGAVMLIGPDGVAHNVSGVAHLVFNDGRIDEGDGSPLVDDLFYDSVYHDVYLAKVDPDQHYAQYGWKEGRNPDAYFSTNYYLSQNPDVKAAGVNPLTDYDTSGWKQGRNPNTNFDTADYMLAYPAVGTAGMDPLAHFLQFGPGGGHLIDVFPVNAGTAGPIDGFDPSYYLAHNPDVAAAGMNPFQHYLQYGWKEGRDPSVGFNTNYYEAHNPDVVAAGIDPLLHYDTYGWREGRDPSAAFSTNGYLTAYPDVAAAGIDPLQHYLQYGMAEGRSPTGA